METQMPANVETMAYRYADRSDVPWHGLGAKIGRDEYVSAETFQLRAGAGWTISKRPVWYRPAPDTPARCDEDHFVLQRDDTHDALHIVGKQYKPVQNAEIFQFFHEFCERGDMVLETGGILDEGRKAWALATLKEGFTLAGGDTVTGHLLLSDSRDGGALRAKFTPVRVVCANTLALALGTHGDTGGEFRLNHRSKFDARAAKNALGISHDMLTKFQEQAQHLRDHSMSSIAFAEFLEKIFPPKVHIDDKGNESVQHPRAREYAIDALDSQRGVEMGRGTWWQGFNAITYMLDHNRNRISNDANRLQNSWFGDGARIRQRALTTALEMAR
jgi:phage/plasmid-like protein (TIGR03299 family)